MGSLDKVTSKEGYVASDMGEEPSESSSAATDVLAAIKANDAKALGVALKLAYEECMGSEGSEEEA